MSLPPSNQDVLNAQSGLVPARQHADACAKVGQRAWLHHSKGFLFGGLLAFATLSASAVCPNFAQAPLQVAEEESTVRGANASLAQRVYTVDYDGNVPGGEYAAVAVDGDLYGQLRNESSDTVNAVAVNDFRSELNRAVAPKRKFVSGHLVNQEFGGNRSNGSNFTVLTSKTNSAMAKGGENSAKNIMTRIHSTYYETNASSTWVGLDDSGPAAKRYKPGILYETEITSDETVLDYETANPGDLLIADPRITDAQKADLVSSLETRLRFILHEYQLDSSGSNPRPTGRWFNMPQSVFDQYIGSSGEHLGVSLPTSSGPDASGTTVTVAPYSSGGVPGGIQITWRYWNLDPSTN